MKFSERHLLPRLPGVYKFTNLITKKVYIGKSVSLRKRIVSHIAPSILKKKEEHITRSINKHGEENFKIELLEVYPARTPFIEKLILEREAFWIMVYDATDKNKGYNDLKFHTDRTGFKPSQETLEKQRQAMLGEKNHQYGKRGDKSPNWGRKFSPSFGEASSKRQKGKKLTPEHIEKLKKSNNKPIVRICPFSGEKVKYDNSTEAAASIFLLLGEKARGKNAIRTNITNGIKLKRIAYGFIWKWAKDLEEKPLTPFLYSVY